MRVRVVGRDGQGWALVRLYEVAVGLDHPGTLTLAEVEDVLARRQAVADGRVSPSQWALVGQAASRDTA